MIANCQCNQTAETTNTPLTKEELHPLSYGSAAFSFRSNRYRLRVKSITYKYLHSLNTMIQNRITQASRSLNFKIATCL